MGEEEEKSMNLKTDFSHVTSIKQQNMEETSKGRKKAQFEMKADFHLRNC